MLKRATGLHYYRFIGRLHKEMLFDWYMEIGCRTGGSFAPVRGKTIAVDPFFQVETNVIGIKPVLHLCQQTSDDFFASKFLANNRIRLSVSFLDGMHLFEFLLRDFIGTESRSAKDGVIMMHDCVPFSQEMTTRDLDNLPGGHWTGDVWKLIPILQTYRPDLTLTVMDCRPTALLCVSNLDPKSQVLKRNYTKICKEYESVTLETFGEDRFCRSFEFTNAREYSKSGFPLFSAASLGHVGAPIPQAVTP